jgi:hypothetical protein
MKAEERFNINIEPLFYQWDDYSSAKTEKMILSGDDAFDVAVMHGGVASFVITKNLVFDWFENMPYVNFDAPWWSADIINNMSVFGKCYYAAGDISHFGLSSTGCILFTKQHSA